MESSNISNLVVGGLYTTTKNEADENKVILRYLGADDKFIHFKHISGHCEYFPIFDDNFGDCILFIRGCSELFYKLSK